MRIAISTLHVPLNPVKASHVLITCAFVLQLQEVEDEDPEVVLVEEREAGEVVVEVLVQAEEAVLVVTALNRLVKCDVHNFNHQFRY